ncbi:putative rhamnosyl transferase [Photobacterium sp. SKA34]|uniref:glycosyltransferase family 2 protein n=1 Tax=Photobacterium sp. SKA34 TaxID=121723 RepID=UPI00006ACD30|nr:glycosyltransferase [Photobacterium sp. SKA34]EAR56466.1 putative rhamnosyl transferase [Photobacterium sp. SKA34]
MFEKRFNFICVNYNGAHFCEKLLDSLEKLLVLNDQKVRLIIVDNNSKIEDKNVLNELITQSSNVEIQILYLPENIGYFPAMNKGINFIEYNNNEVVIIGNNDLEYSDDFLIEYEKLNLDKNTLVISPNVITIDGKYQNPISVRKLSKIEFLIEEIYYSNYYVSRLMIKSKALFNKVFKKEKNILNEKPHRGIIKRGIGACYVLTDNFFKFYNELDAPVFMWGEEAILSNQVNKAEGHIMLEPTLLVTHAESGTVKKILNKTRYEMVRASFKIYKKYL